MKYVFLPLVFFINFTEAAPSTRVIPDQLYFPTLMETLDSAKESIDILQFSFAADKPGSLPNQIADKLIALKKEHPRLKIRLYFESERDTAARNKITAEYLEKNGIETKEGKTHAKGFAIDSDTLLVGSTNLTTQSIKYNNETNLLFKEHPLLSQGFRKYFELLWNDEKRTPFQFPEKPEAGAQLLTDGLYKEAILKAIASATKTIDFSIYYFNDADIEKALIEAATRKKVKVRGYVNQDKNFAVELVERNRKTVARLKAAGISEVYFDLDGFFSHSKYLIVDGHRLLLGTGNWNRSDVEEHPQVYFDVEDEYQAGKLSRHLSHQIAYESEREIPAKPFIRFWNGYAITEKGFDEAIRDHFLRATVKTGDGGGLIGYLPALTANRDVAKGLVPDETALVVYQDEPTYRAIRESAVGEVYGPLHGDYFEMSKSKSTVPLEYKGSVATNNAYDLSQAGFDWRKGNVLFILTQSRGRLDDKAVASYLAELSASKPEGYLIYVEDGFLVEYIGRSNKWSVEAIDALKALQKKHLAAAYQPPSQMSEARSKAFDGNDLARPGAVNTKMDGTLRAQKFLDNSLASFSRDQSQDAELRKKTKQSFVDNLPVPTID